MAHVHDIERLREIETTAAQIQRLSTKDAWEAAGDERARQDVMAVVQKLDGKLRDLVSAHNLDVEQLEREIAHVPKGKMLQLKELPPHDAIEGELDTIYLPDDVHNEDALDVRSEEAKLVDIPEELATEHRLAWNVHVQVALSLATLGIPNFEAAADHDGLHKNMHNTPKQGLL